MAYGDYIRAQDKVFTPEVRGWSRTGKEEENTCSYREELVAFLMLLERVPREAVILDYKSKIIEI